LSIASHAARTSTTALTVRVRRSATRRRRLGRGTTALLFAVLAFAWLAITTVVAVRHGEERRSRFNGSLRGER